MNANPASQRTQPTPWTTALLLGGLAFVVAAIQQSSATASPNNCGELPGIVRTMTMLIGIGVAAAILVLAGIAAAIMKRPAVFGVAAAVAAGCVAGLVVGGAVTSPHPCGSDLPQPTRQVATLVLTLNGEFAGTRVEGPGECRRSVPGGDVWEVVSDLAARSAWVIDNGAVRVELEVYPRGGSPDPAADYVRVFLNREASGFASYADGDGTDVADVQISGSGGSQGRISFAELPPWSDNRPGAGLPQSIGGAIQWTCSGPEE